MLIAGHTFDDSHDPVCTGSTTTGEPCPIRWSSIAHVTTEHVGQRDIAHYAELNTREAEEIMAERARREARADAIWGAVLGVAKT